MEAGVVCYYYYLPMIGVTLQHFTPTQLWPSYADGGSGGPCWAYCGVEL